VTETNTSSDFINEQLYLTAYCLENDIPFIPTTGLWSLSAWAKFLGQEERTVRDWVKTYAIQHKGTSKSLYIDAEHLRQCIPEDCLFNQKGKTDAEENTNETCQR